MVLSRKLFLLLSVGLVSSVASAVTNECFVGAGESKSVADFGYAWATNDWLLKTGPGILSAVNNRTVPYNLLIQEGVYSVGSGVFQKGGATLIVRNGATLNCAGTTAEAFSGDWAVHLSGNGVGTGDNLGAISLGGNLLNPTFGTASKFYLTEDVTIYTYGTMNAVFSGSTANGGPTLFMNSHTLTLRGKDANAIFRPRWKWIIKNAGPIVVRNGQFARQDTTNAFSPNVPCVAVKDGGMLAAYSDGKIWSKVDAFDFEWGSSMAKGNGSPQTATLTMKKLSGPATITNTVLTVSDELVARGSDLLAGHCLTVADSLAFADGCALSVAELHLLSLNPDATYVVAEAESGITGLPTLTGEAADFFTVAVSGGQLLLKAKATNKQLALREGADHAADNTAAFAALTLEDGDRIAIPAGDFHFSGPIDLTGSTASNVALYCFAGTNATLRAGMRIGAMQAVTLRNLTFKGFDDPAVVATGTVGLTVEDCTLDAVKGAWGEAGNYPYALVGVTDFTLRSPTYVPDAEGADSTLWDAPAYFEGGSQTEDSEAREGMLVIMTPTGVVLDDWWHFHDMTDSFHLTQAAYRDKTLCKRDYAALDVESTDSLLALGIAGIDVWQGQYVARADNALGVAGAPVHVRSGANLTLCGANEAAKNRVITFSGTGVSSVNPAVRFTGSASWNKTSGVIWALEGDAVMYNNCSGECGVFLWSGVRTAGHTLTLKGLSSSNYRFGRTTDWTGGGTVVVDGVKLSASSGTNANGYKLKDGVKPVFRFVNKARFVPDNADIFGIVKVVDFESGTAIAVKDSIAGFALAFDSLTGVPTVSAKFTKLTVSEAYAARLDEVTAGNKLTLSETTPLAFADGVTVTLLGDELAAPTQTYALVSAPGGITGRKPRLDAAAKSVGWGLSYSADRTELLAGPKQGTFVIVR